MNRPQHQDTWLERAFLVRLRRTPQIPIRPEKIAALLIAKPRVLIATATLLSIVTFYVPEAVAYSSYINEPGMHTATRPSWTMFNVGIWIAGSTIFWLFAIYRTKLDKEIADRLIIMYPSLWERIEAEIRGHCGVGRIAVLCVLVAAAIISTAVFVQGSTLWLFLASEKGPTFGSPNGDHPG